MRVTVTVEDEVSANLERFVQSRLPEARLEMVEEAARLALTETIRANPVDTARSRAAWVASLEQLGGVPPADWRGPHPTADDEGRGQAMLTQQHERDVTEIVAGNLVEYVPFLEYGTSRMRPFGMVRRALGRLRPLVAALFRRALS